MLDSMHSKPTTIRLTDEEKADAKRKGEAHGVKTIAGVLRFALKRLPMPK